MKLCIKCKTREKAPTGKTGKCYICSRGHLWSDEARKNAGLVKLGIRNGMWKGDMPINMSSLHEWVAKRLTKPSLCPECNKKPPFDLANKGQYNRNLKNWEWLCRKCHMVKDGRLKKLIYRMKSEKYRKKISEAKKKWWREKIINK